MAKEYIEREALLKDISESVVFSVREGQPSLEIRGANKITGRIKAAPIADVVEVKHGYWKQNPYCKRIYYCSICGRHIEDCTGNYKEHFPYCHCGAKMDAERKCEDD